VRGSHRDYTEGSIGRAVVLLAIPMVAEMIMESIFAIADIFWVSKLGADSVAAVGITESMLALIYAIAIGVSIGATATVARRIGEKDPEHAATAAVQAIALGISLAIPIGITGALLAPKLLSVMGASPALVATGWRYTAIMLGGNVIIMLLFLINAIFRGAGDAAIAMRVLWFANILNIVLGPCFIFGLGPFPKLGVTGAAVATSIGRGSGVLFQLWTLSRRRGRVVIERRHWKLEPAAMLRMLRLSGNAMFQILIGTASWIGLVRIISAFGSAALAGYTIGIRMIVFALLPSWGMSNAAATLVGQNLGAGKPERAEKSVWIAPYGIQCLRDVSYGFLFYAYGMVLTQAFNGAGDTWTPTWLNLFVFWLWEIPLAYVLAKVLGWGPRGVFIAITIAFSTLAVASAILFRRGRWKLKKV
jgi:MATE family, multidrug efflux pump